MYHFQTTLADDRPHWHQEYPKSHHRQCPRHYCCTLPHVPRIHWCLQLNEYLLVHKQLLQEEKESSNWCMTYTPRIIIMYYFSRGVVVPGRHLTPASSKWLQLWFPIGFAGQSTSLLSLPRQPTLSRRMGPVPWPNRAKRKAVAPACAKCTNSQTWLHLLVSIELTCRRVS